VTAAVEMIGSAGSDERVHRLVQVDESRGRSRGGRPALVDVWVRRCSTLMVAGVAATPPMSISGSSP
jgi:hypothetical protein